jgi:hypothetical protein
MNRIKEIVDLWFDQSEEAKCKHRYQNDCNGCPFFFQPDPNKEDMACKTVWMLFEKANKNLKQFP